MKSIQIFPSLISANLLNLQSVIDQLAPSCDGFHLDVMDNHFVPNLTWGAQFINAIARATSKPLFVHLMVDRSDEFVKTLSLRPNDEVGFHIEESKNISTMINWLHENKLQASLAINPKTPISELYPFLNLIDSVLLMSVQPGFSGQQFLQDSIERLNTLTDYRTQHNLDFDIVMDGGINKTNIGTLAKKGVSQVGIASGIFDHQDTIKALTELYQAAKGS